METLPSIWRTEVLHALSVHLPLTSLILATLFFLTTLVIKKSWISKASGALLIIGTIGAWISMLTGDAADGIVSRSLCDPTILKAHENFATITTILFTVASVVYILSSFIDWGIRLKKLFKVIIGLLLIAGTAFLMYVGHLGASLVYQQGAGTHQPGEDCSAFRK